MIKFWSKLAQKFIALSDQGQKPISFVFQSFILYNWEKFSCNWYNMDRDITEDDLDGFELDYPTTGRVRFKKVLYFGWLPVWQVVPVSDGHDVSFRPGTHAFVCTTVVIAGG